MIIRILIFGIGMKLEFNVYHISYNKKKIDYMIYDKH